MSVVTLVSGPDRSGPGGFTYARIAGTRDGTIVGFDPRRDTLALVVLLPRRARGVGFLRGIEVDADLDPQGASSSPSRTFGPGVQGRGRPMRQGARRHRRPAHGAAL